MDEYNLRSRVNKFDKRRKNTKAITMLIITGGILFLLLLIVFIFGGKDKDKDSSDNSNIVANNNEDINDDEQNNENKDNLETNEQDNNVQNNDQKTNDNGSQSEDEESNPDNDNNDEKETVVTEHSDDENVISAFSKNWDPIGTEQSEPHTINYGEGTQDRIEMEKAVKVATGLDEMYVWWLGRDGDQKVVATVTSTDQTENYRVYISWISEQGWQPTKVEILKINDQHPDRKNN